MNRAITSLFFLLGLITSINVTFAHPDEYIPGEYEIEKGDNLRMMAKDIIPNSKLDDPVYEEIYMDLLKEWNPHIKDWRQMPVGTKIYISRPASPFFPMDSKTIYTPTRSVTKNKKDLKEMRDKGKPTRWHAFFDVAYQYRYAKQSKIVDADGGKIESSWSNHEGLILSSVRYKKKFSLFLGINIAGEKKISVPNSSENLTMPFTYNLEFGGKALSIWKKVKPFLSIKKETMHQITYDQTPTLSQVQLMASVKKSTTKLYWIRAGADIYITRRIIVTPIIGKTIKGESSSVYETKDASGLLLALNERLYLSKNFWFGAELEYKSITEKYKTSSMSGVASIGVTFPKEAYNHQEKKSTTKSTPSKWRSFFDIAYIYQYTRHTRNVTATEDISLSGQRHGALLIGGLRYKRKFSLFLGLNILDKKIIEAQEASKEISIPYSYNVELGGKVLSIWKRVKPYISVKREVIHDITYDSDPTLTTASLLAGIVKNTTTLFWVRVGSDIYLTRKIIVTPTIGKTISGDSSSIYKTQDSSALLFTTSARLYLTRNFWLGAEVEYKSISEELKTTSIGGNLKLGVSF